MLQNTNMIIENTISLALAGGSLYLLKDLPSIIISKLINWLTTELNLSNHNVSYYNFLEWFENSRYKKYSRNLQVTNGRWGYDSNSVISAGKGIHFFKFKNKWAVMRVIREQTNDDKPREYVFIRYLGFDQARVSDLISEVTAEKDDHPNEYRVHLFNDGWRNLGYEYKRCFSTVYIKENIKNEIFNVIDTFKSSKEDYIKKGIPYRLL